MAGVLEISNGFGAPQSPDSIAWGAGLTVIAIVLLAERRFLEFDVRSGLLLRKRGVIYPFTLAPCKATDVKHIGLIQYIARSGSGPQTRNCYKLHINDRPDWVLVDLGNMWRARKAGERLCATLKVPFDNVVYGGVHSVRPPNELDLPVAQRWYRAGEVHERPALPPGSNLVVEEIGPNVSVLIPAQTYNLKYAGVLMLFFGMLGVLFYSITSAGSRWVIDVLFGAFLVFFVVALLAFSGHSRLTFSERRVSFRQGRSPFSRSMEFLAIEELIPAPEGIDLVGDSKRLWIHWPAADADSEFLQALVAYEIERRTPTGAYSLGDTRRMPAGIAARPGPQSNRFSEDECDDESRRS